MKKYKKRESKSYPQMVDDFKAGKTLKELVNTYRISYFSLKRLLYQNGLYPIGDGDLIMEALEAGMSDDDVRKKWGLSKDKLWILKSVCDVPPSERLNHPDTSARDTFILSLKKEFPKMSLQAISDCVAERYNRISRQSVSNVLKKERPNGEVYSRSGT